MCNSTLYCNKAPHSLAKQWANLMECDRSWDFWKDNMFLEYLKLVQKTKASAGGKISNFPGIQNYHSFLQRHVSVDWMGLWLQLFPSLLITLLTERSNTVELLGVSYFNRWTRTNFTCFHFLFEGTSNYFTVARGAVYETMVNCGSFPDISEGIPG